MLGMVPSAHDSVQEMKLKYMFRQLSTAKRDLQLPSEHPVSCGAVPISPDCGWRMHSETGTLCHTYVYIGFKIAILVACSVVRCFD